MLSKYPIDVETECHAYAMEASSSSYREVEMCRTRNNATGLQSSKLKGLSIDSDTVVGVPYTTYDKYYSTETYYADYENSLIKDYVEKYVKLLKKQYGASVRGDLFSLDDVISFYMTMRKNYPHATVIPDEYSWLNSSTYWTRINDYPRPEVVLNVITDELYEEWENDTYVEPFYALEASALRPVITINVDNIKNYKNNKHCKDNVCFTDNDEDGKVSLSDLVCIDKECFYVLDVNKYEAKLLSRYNLESGNICTSSQMMHDPYSLQSQNSILQGNKEILGLINSYDVNVRSRCTAIPIQKGIQNYKALGDRAIGFSGGGYGITQYANESHAGSKLTSYKGSIVKDYVDDYVDYLKDLTNFDITGTLIDIEDIEDALDFEFESTHRNSCRYDKSMPALSTNILGIQFQKGITEKTGETTYGVEFDPCYEINLYVDEDDNINVPYWLFSTTYWTKTSYDNYSVIAISPLVISDTYVGMEDSAGVRPLITIPLEVIETGSTTISACYICDDELVWTDKPGSSCKLNSDIKTQGMCINNPKTGIRKIVIISLIVALVMVLGYVLYRRHNRFENV